MSKLVLNDAGSGYGLPTVINANNAATQAALENTLSRDGASPNGMNASLDMNSQRIINVGSPQSATDAVRLTDVTSLVNITGLAAPSQTGNANKALFTDGSVASWRDPTYIKVSGSETLAGISTPSLAYEGGEGRPFNVFRAFSAAEIIDVVTGVGSIDVSAKIQSANDYLEGRAAGSIGTINALVGGAGYNGGGSGTFSPVQLTGGAGQFASAIVTVTAGVVTAVSILGPGKSFSVSNVLTILAADLITAGAAAGGSGATVTVATLAVGGRTYFSGGKLVFPAGVYYNGTTDLRIGDMVNWDGESISGFQLLWNNSHTGKCVSAGPDKSGFNGRGGFYAMGCSLQKAWIKCGNNSAYGLYTSGLQQNGKFKDVWISNFNNVAVFLKDTQGSANILCEDVYAFGGQAMSASAIGFQVDGGANCVLNRCSTNGGNINLNTGIQVDGGDVKIRDFQCEGTVSHVVVNHGTRDGLVHIDKAVFNLGVVGSVRGLWIKSGFIGTVVATGIDAGPGQLMIQNDVDGVQRVAGSPAGYIPIYAFAGTVNDISNIDNVVIGHKRGANLTVSGAGLTLTPNVANGKTFLINATTTNAFNVGKPTYGPTAFPGSLQQGRHLRLQFYNSSGGVMGTPTFDAIYHLAGAFVKPINGTNRTYEFEFDGAVWYEVNRTAADVTN